MRISDWSSDVCSSDLGVGLLIALVLGTEMIPLFLFAPVMFVGIANGLSLPSAIASGISLRPDLAGTASGLLGFLQMVVGALATWAVGELQDDTALPMRSEEHTSELQSLMRISYAVFCLKKKNKWKNT